MMIEKKWSACIFSAIAIFGSLPSICDAQVELNLKPSYEQIEIAALNATPSVNNILDGPVVLFIPGILGSKLYDPSGKPIWGKNISPTLKTLAYSSRAKAELLEEYPLGVTREDVYGDFKNLLSAAMGGKGYYYEFAYDWRADISETVDELESRIQNELAERFKKKNVIIIAHSMGGVIAWHWKNKYFQKRHYDFHLAKMVLLGAPLKGSCEMLRILLQGYKPIKGSGELIEKVYGLVFKDLQPAAYTFPSVFQLLPVSDPLDPYSSCLVLEKEVQGKIVPFPVNHFSIDIWEKHLFPFIKGGFFSASVWDKLGMKKDDFKKALDDLLQKASNFRTRQTFPEDSLSDKVEYFYSADYSTTFQAYVTSNVTLDEGKGSYINGDGRVMKESATNDKNYGLIPRSAASPHDALVKSGSFVRYVQDQFKKEVQTIKIKSVATALASDPVAKKIFAQSGLILSFSDLDEDPVLGRNTVEAKAILELNTSTLEAFASMAGNECFKARDASHAAYACAKYVDKDLKNPKNAIPLYETALASGKITETQYVEVLNRYGEVLFDSDYNKSALVSFSIAKALVEKSPGSYPPNFRLKLTNNYSLSAWQEKGRTRNLTQIMGTWGTSAKMPTLDTTVGQLPGTADVPY